MGNTENCPIDKRSSKEETTNYCRIILLMVDVGTETLLHLFIPLFQNMQLRVILLLGNQKLKMGKGRKSLIKISVSS